MRFTAAPYNGCPSHKESSKNLGLDSAEIKLPGIHTATITVSVHKSQ
jgi:hypothetical protein